MADELLAHARSEVPNEACGLLVGDLASGSATAYHPARNAEASPLRYNVHPDDLVRIVFGDRGRGRGPGRHLPLAHPLRRPSPRHRPAPGQYPDAFYLLATLADPDAGPAEALRAWRIRDGESAEVPLRIG